MPTWIKDPKTGATDYRLNLLGLRVLKDTCQLICKNDGKWTPFGLRWQLPIRVPEGPKDLPHAHVVAVTAYQFCRACPEAGLEEVLTQAPFIRYEEPAFRFGRQYLQRLRDPLLQRGSNADAIAQSRALIKSSRILLGEKQEDA